MTGITAGEWCPYGYVGELPIDQRADDGRSLVFDSAALEAPLELLGTPRVTLRLAIDRPVGIVTARLCEVAPDGASTLISYGVFNLTRREGFDRSVPMRPGEACQRQLPLERPGPSVQRGFAVAPRLVDQLLAHPLAGTGAGDHDSASGGVPARSP